MLLQHTRMGYGLELHSIQYEGIGSGFQDSETGSIAGDSYA